ncbi:DUF3696 domain-containing protein [Xenophilus sp. Marseille-Q4582]|uniref:DUF3696 domain-containing protein n=1 Tax=Xenophilus sp. Marseille-Q4582 TaxID=2866600 RepID=UPI001CE43DE9|nr:DUF3696 domain-containing protein [Xenophilus sp. Marseille-Q4582]
MKVLIQGFKSIKDVQYIQLGEKITFLVGPNSAGKSILKLALDRIVGNKIFDLDVELIHKGGNGKEDELSEVHAIGVAWKKKQNTYEKVFSYRFDFADSDTRSIDDVNIEKGIGYSKNNSKLLDVCSTHYLEEDPMRNMLNILFKKIGGTPVTYKFEMKSWPDEDQKKFQEIKCWKRSNLRTSEVRAAGSEDGDDPALAGSLAWLQRPDGSSLPFAVFDPSAKGLESQKKNNILGRYGALLERAKNRVTKDFDRHYPLNGVKIALVSANRTIPNSGDLDFFINEGNDVDESIYQVLARSSLAKEWDNSFGDFNLQRRQKNSNLFINVNKALSDNLFLDNGYQVFVDSKLLCSKEELDAIREGDEDEKDEHIYRCKVSLTDNHRRKLGFDDVGSGIGYVLPVLIEAFSPNNENGIVFMQQPELHLHPALQANLTDVFIEAAADRRIVVETHSEHLILRALRRVRETTNNKIKDASLRISSEDIAINYFEPLPDGSTKVHIIRVSDDGDFLDRWPHGFFSERDAELFDE